MCFMTEFGSVAIIDDRKTFEFLTAANSLSGQFYRGLYERRLSPRRRLYEPEAGSATASLISTETKYAEYTAFDSSSAPPVVSGNRVWYAPKTV